MKNNLLTSEACFFTRVNEMYLVKGSMGEIKMVEGGGRD